MNVYIGFALERVLRMCQSKPVRSFSLIIALNILVGPLLIWESHLYCSWLKLTKGHDRVIILLLLFFCEMNRPTLYSISIFFYIYIFCILNVFHVIN